MPYEATAESQVSSPLIARAGIHKERSRSDQDQINFEKKVSIDSVDQFGIHKEQRSLELKKSIIDTITIVCLPRKPNILYD